MTIALGLVGVMALWLGIVKIAEDSGLMALLARAIAPVLKWLFPDVPKGHPAMASMTMNIAANMLGLSNAATPLGIKAMEDLETLNPRPGVATNAMCTFLTINTASLQLIPATMIGVMASAGSRDPAAIIGTTIAATCCALTAGIARSRSGADPFFAADRGEGEMMQQIIGALSAWAIPLFLVAIPCTASPGASGLRVSWKGPRVDSRRPSASSPT